MPVMIVRGHMNVIIYAWNLLVRA